MMPEENLVALVNFNPAYFAKSDNYVIFLDVNTGEEKYRIEHLNNYVQNRTYIRGDRLVLDYYGLEIFDIKKEERIVLSIDEKVVKASNAVSSLLGSSDGEKNKTSRALPSVIGERIAYTTTNKVGNRVYPLMTGGGRNIKLHAYDLKTGEKLWSTKELENGSMPLDLATGQVIMKHQSGLNKHIFYGIDIKSGEVRGSTDKIKQYLLRTDAGYVLMPNSILFSGKKGLYLYDLKSWSLIDEIDVKDADIGKLQAIDVTDDGLFMVGDKGVAFYDEQGNFTGNLEIRRIEGSVWTHDAMIVFTQKDIKSVSLNEYKKTGSIEQQENVIFSDNLKHWLMESNDFLEKYTLTLR
jgi:outer membrane protein assembly factor BamB